MLRTTLTSLAVALSLAGGVAGPLASAAHARPNDGRYAKTVGSRFRATAGQSPFYCGDTLALYQGAQAEADADIARWDFAAANIALDGAAQTKATADGQGCAWPHAV